MVATSYPSTLIFITQIEKTTPSSPPRSKLKSTIKINLENLLALTAPRIDRFKNKFWNENSETTSQMISNFLYTIFTSFQRV